MRDTIKVIGGTLAICLGAALVLEYCFRDYQSRVDGLFEQIRADDGKADLVLLGNCNVGVLGGMTFGGKSKPLNLVDGGKDIFHDLLMLKYLKRSRRLRLVIMGMEYEILGFDFNISNQKFLDRQYYSHTGLLYDDSLSNRLMAMSHFLRSGRDFFRVEKKADFTEFQPPVDEVLSDEACRKRALDRTQLFFDGRLIPANLSRLQELIALAEAHGARMVFVNTPKRRCYIDNAHPENTAMARAAVYEFLNSSRAGNAVYLDYYGDPRFDDGDLRDYTHIGVSGAEKLRRVLSTDLKARGVLGR